MRQLSHRPIDSAYYNEDYRIFEISWTLLLIFWILPFLYLLLQFWGKYPGTTFLLHYEFWKHRSKYLHYRPLINDHVTEGNTQVVFLVWVTLVLPWCFLGASFYSYYIEYQGNTQVTPLFIYQYRVGNSHQKGNFSRKLPWTRKNLHIYYYSEKPSLKHSWSRSHIWKHEFYCLFYLGSIPCLSVFFSYFNWKNKSKIKVSVLCRVRTKKNWLTKFWL